uniref:Uncharacterized protein n=1 Tax=Arundo donax TaxID=35708 RepID=A0A0A9GN20_ARUDO
MLRCRKNYRYQKKFFKGTPSDIYLKTLHSSFHELLDKHLFAIISKRSSKHTMTCRIYKSTSGAKS